MRSEPSPASPQSCGCTDPPQSEPWGGNSPSSIGRCRPRPSPWLRPRGPVDPRRKRRHRGLLSMGIWGAGARAAELGGWGEEGRQVFLISSPVLQIRLGLLSPPWFPWQQHEDEEPCPGFADAEVGILKVLELWGREGVPRAPLSPSAAELPPGATIPPAGMGSAQHIPPLRAGQIQPFLIPESPICRPVGQECLTLFSKPALEMLPTTLTSAVRPQPNPAQTQRVWYSKKSCIPHHKT